MIQRLFMRRVFVLLAAVGLVATTAEVSDVAAGDRAFSNDIGVKRAGNWSRADQEAADAAAAAAAAEADTSEIPVPRLRPGSKAAKAEAARKKKAEAAKKKKAEAAKKSESKERKVAKTESGDVPIPRKKKRPKKAVEAGLAESEGSGNTSAPYRGRLESDEIKELLNGRVLTSRIDGRKANITLAEGGELSWRSSVGQGQGRWWTEKGRICDRYDPSGDFPGRGAGCRSFEQKSDGLYAGGRKLRFVN